MRTLTTITITLALFTSLLAAGCLTPGDPSADPAGDDAATEATVSSNEITPVPLCPDVHKNLMGLTRSCFLPDGGEGIRICTDHITFHYIPKFKLPTGFPPVSDFDCVLTGTDVTTTCGPCQDLDLPPL